MYIIFLLSLATLQCLVKIDKGQQKIKIVCTNQQPDLQGSCQSMFSLCWHHPEFLPINFPCAGTCLTRGGWASKKDNS